MKRQLQTILWPDGKTMVHIPGGETMIGSETGYSDEKPIHPFTTKGFYMDTTPVTNAEYKQFCDATEKEYPTAPPWPGMKNYFLEYPNYPVINVTFEECKAYAAWAKKRLPTEEEWEYAAQGGLTNARYPWGEKPPYYENTAMANFADKQSGDEWFDPFADDGYRYTSPVGQYPPNGYGLYDMAGNVYQYTDDKYFPYTQKPAENELIQDGWGSSQVCRGGSFHSPAQDLRIARRHCILGGGKNEAVGFRCVADREHIPSDACVLGKSKTHRVPSAKEKTDGILSSLKAAKGPGTHTELCCGIGTNDADESLLNGLKKLGFTSAEQYVTWRSCEEKGRGKWDFSKWDIQVEALQKAGIKWLPFLIAGPAYSLPDWFLHSEDHHGLCCAEHRLESKVQSLWDKGFYRYIDRFFKQFAQHFSNPDLLEGLLLGISGDFGEAITSVWHGNWPTIDVGTYHAHAGYWCADRFAMANFRKAMQRKYKSDLSRLNQAWQTHFTSFETLEFPKLFVDIDHCRIDGYTDEGQLIAENAGDRIRIVDFVDWYRASMTEYVGVWLKIARKYFPHTKLYLCTGGEAQPCHASEFAAQSKMCAKYDAGVRITNEDSKFEKNFCITNWVASACSFYGADFSFEPAGSVTNRGVVCRIYNASATGAKGLHFYSGNILGSKEHYQQYEKNIPYFTNTAVKRELALFYPDTAAMFDPARRKAMYTSFSVMRDYSDYLYADDITLQDGILKTVKALILTVGGYYRKDTLHQIKQFVKNGGLLIGCGIDMLRTVEDDSDYLPELFALQGQKSIGKGQTLFVTQAITENITDDAINQTVFKPITTFLNAHGIAVSDGKRDRLYIAQKGDGLLIMNYSGKPIRRTLQLPNGQSTCLQLKDACIAYVE